MRIVKKEKVDVKKFMEEMKANRTNRSYTSLEKRAPRTPEPPPEWATGACESYSKVSAPPYLYQPHNKQDSYRFYSSYSQMSQNSQPFMASQLASTFNQPYYPYGQQFYANPAPLCPNREPYYSYPPPNPNKSLR